jgi:hypothetical protein
MREKVQVSMKSKITANTGITAVLVMYEYYTISVIDQLQYNH